MKISKTVGKKLSILLIMVAMMMFTSCATSLCEAYTINDESNSEVEDQQEQKIDHNDTYI